jgi:hypothetical protein
MTVARAEGIIAPVLERWPNRPQVRVVQSGRDLPASIRAAAPGVPEGVWDGNTVWLVADMLPTRADVERVLAHEAVGHAGLEQILGDDYLPIMRTIALLRRSKDPKAKALFAKLRERYAGLYGPDGKVLDLDGEAREFMAVLAEARPTEGGLGKLWRRIQEAVTRFLRALGLRYNPTMADLQVLLSMAEARLREAPRGRLATDGARFSASDQQLPPFEVSALRSITAGDTMQGGMTVGEDIANTGSIAATLGDDYETIGLREIPMDEWGVSSATDVFYEVSDVRRAQELAEELRASQRVDPLIVVVQPNGEPYILEGNHRLAALAEMNAEAFPALVVRDTSEDAETGHRFSLPAQADAAPRRVEPQAVMRGRRGQVNKARFDADTALAWLDAPQQSVVTGLIATGKAVRGADVLGWLREYAGKPVHVVAATPTAQPFYRKMQDRGVIAGWTEQGVGEYMAGTGSARFSLPAARHQRPPQGQHPNTLYGKLPNGEVGAMAYPTGRRDDWEVVLVRNATGELFANGPRRSTVTSRRLAEIGLQRQGLTLEGLPPAKVQAQQSGVFDGASFDPAQDSLLDTVRTYLQDRHISLRRTQEAILRARGEKALPDDLDAYMAEELYHRRAASRIEKFEEQHLDPLFQLMADSGIEIEQVNDYMRARHAEEANAALKAINPDRQKNDELSGMSNERAAQIMAAARSDGTHAALERIAKMVDGINAERLDIIESEGLETRGTVKAWRDKYRYYVPLHRERATPSFLRRGQGFNIRGRESKARVGSTREVVNVLANVVAQYETTVIRAEKNTVGRTLLRLVEANPNPAVWEVNRVEYQAVIDPKTGLVVRRPDPTHQIADNVLSVKVDGKVHHISFNERDPLAMRMAFNLKNLGAQDTNSIVRTLGMVNRYLAMMNTSLTPEFVISNFIRDIQTAGINLQGTEAKSATGAILRDVGKAYAGIRDAQKGKDSAWARFFREFDEAGATTGWIDVHRDIDAKSRKLERDLLRFKPGAKGAAHRTIRSVFNLVQDINTAVENGVRLSTFVHARRLGLSSQRAASLAKNLTVNFNRKGQWGTTANALYLFYNASVQGSVRVLQAAKSPRARKVMGAVVVAAIMLDLLNRLISGEDDDGKNYYDAIKPWVKERNLIIMRPGTSGDYFKLPLPYGYNVLNTFGQQIGAALPGRFGNEDWSLGKATMDLGSSIMGSFNPIGSEASIVQMVSPTIIDPFVQWGENQDWAGRPLRKEQLPFGAPKPEYQMYWGSTSPMARWVTEWLSDVTGGDQIVGGAVDLNPAMLDHFWQAATGGLGMFASNTLDVPTRLLTGEDLETYRIPFVRKVVGSQSPARVRGDFREATLDLQLAKRRVKHYQEIIATVSPDERPAARRRAMEIRREHKAELRLEPAAKAVQRQIKALRRRIGVIEASDMAPARKQATKKLLEERMRAIQARFLRKYREQVKGLGAKDDEAA